MESAPLRPLAYRRERHKRLGLAPAGRAFTGGHFPAAEQAAAGLVFFFGKKAHDIPPRIWSSAFSENSGLFIKLFRHILQ